MDYQALNELMVKNSYPLPQIQDCLDNTSQARVFSKLDLLSGY